MICKLVISICFKVKILKYPHCPVILSLQLNIIYIQILSRTKCVSNILKKSAVGKVNCTLFDVKYASDSENCQPTLSHLSTLTKFLYSQRRLVNRLRLIMKKTRWKQRIWTLFLMQVKENWRGTEVNISWKMCNVYTVLCVNLLVQKF